MISALKAIFDFLKDIRHYLRFPNAYIAFRGVFQSFEEAMRNTPRNAAQRGSTYNDAKSDELEQLAHAYSKPIKLTDMEYPLFFWLDKITHSATQTRVCDFGGGNGRHYFAYTSHARDVNLEWSVCELAHNVKLGNALAQRLQIPNLRFYEGLDSEPLYQSNVFLSSGAIFYIKDVYESLRRFLSYGGGGVEYILLTRIPLQDKSPTYVTLQNALNQFYAPLYIFNRDEFLSFFSSLGYELLDEWRDPFDGSTIPFHRDISAQEWRGMAFVKSIK